MLSTRWSERAVLATETAAAAAATATAAATSICPYGRSGRTRIIGHVESVHSKTVVQAVQTGSGRTLEGKRTKVLRRRRRRRRFRSKEYSTGSTSTDTLATVSAGSRRGGITSVTAAAAVAAKMTRTIVHLRFAYSRKVMSRRRVDGIGRERPIEIGARRRKRIVDAVVGRPVDGAARAQGDVALDFAFRYLGVFRRSGHFEAGLLVARRRDDVRVRQLLNALDRRAFRSDDETDDPIGNANFDRDLIFAVDESVRRRDARAVREARAARAAVRRRRRRRRRRRIGTESGRGERRRLGRRRFSGGAYLREVFGGGEDFSFRHGHVFASARHDEDRIFAAHGRLDVRVRLRSQRLDFAAFFRERETREVNIRSGEGRRLPKVVCSTRAKKNSQKGGSKQKNAFPTRFLLAHPV